MKDSPKNPALLVRISDDRADDRAGVGRQESDTRALAKRLGWGAGELFVENDTSAFKRKAVTLPDGSTGLRVFRPEFRRLLEAISLGQVDGLIAYHLDRVARDPRDLEDLIDVVEQTRIPVDSVTGSLRLASDADITMARIGVAIANQSSRDASRRIRRKQDELAESGSYSGGGARRYGYERDGMTVIPEEADVLRYAARRVIEGASVTAIGRELDEQGHRPVKAARWSSKTLSDQLRSARVAGLRKHRGEIVGEAAWPAILERDTWEHVQVALNARRTHDSRRELVHWLSGLLFCGLCGKAMPANFVREGAHRYWCHSGYGRGGCGRIAIQGNGAEGEAHRQIVEYLTRPDVAERLSEVTSRRGADRARVDLAADEHQLRDLSRMWAEKAITLDEYAEARRIIQARIDGARAVQMAQIPETARKVISADRPGEAFAALDPFRKREAARVLLASLGFKGWKVDPHDASKARRFDPSRMDLAEAEK
ncbi:MAG: recombinase family protein [Nocardioides sp.]